MELKEIRQKIDAVDGQMKELFLKRMELSGRVAEAKRRTGGAVYVKEREAEVLGVLRRSIRRAASGMYGIFWAYDGNQQDISVFFAGRRNGRYAEASKERRSGGYRNLVSVRPCGFACLMPECGGSCGITGRRGRIL